MLSLLIERHQIRAVSTYLQPKRGRSPCTYINNMPGNAPSQIEYIMISKRWPSSMQQCNVQWGVTMWQFSRGKYDRGALIALSKSRCKISRTFQRKDFRTLRAKPKIAHNYEQIIENSLKNSPVSDKNLATLCMSLRKAAQKGMQFLPCLPKRSPSL